MKSKRESDREAHEEIGRKTETARNREKAVVIGKRRKRKKRKRKVDIKISDKMKYDLSNRTHYNLVMNLEIANAFCLLTAQRSKMCYDFCLNKKDEKDYEGCLEICSKKLSLG